jgi:hypothetical protein
MPSASDSAIESRKAASSGLMLPHVTLVVPDLRRTNTAGPK